MKKYLAIACSVAAFGLASILGPNYVSSEPKEKQEIKPLPEYSLEGVKPEVYYYEWIFQGWCFMGDRPFDAKGPVIKVEKFIVDRNKDGVADLKILKYYMPEGTYENEQSKIVTQKAHQKLVVYVDDDLDKLWDRRLYDEVDASGNPGMDGVFEKEEAVCY